MKRVWRLRARGSLSRQWAAYNPADSSKLLADVEYSEKLAAAELAEYFAACNSFGSSVLIQAEIANSNEAQRQSSDAAWAFELLSVRDAAAAAYAPSGVASPA